MAASFHVRPLFDGNVYFGSEDQRLHVVSARSGKVVWTYYTDGPIRSSPRIAEGHILLARMTRTCMRST